LCKSNTREEEVIWRGLKGLRLAAEALAEKDRCIQQRKCIICTDRPVSNVHYPCGHFSFCGHCIEHEEALDLTRCPCCFAQVESMPKAYFPWDADVELYDLPRLLSMFVCEMKLHVLQVEHYVHCLPARIYRMFEIATFLRPAIDPDDVIERRTHAENEVAQGLEEVNRAVMRILATHDQQEIDDLCWRARDHMNLVWTAFVRRAAMMAEAIEMNVGVVEDWRHSNISWKQSLAALYPSLPFWGISGRRAKTSTCMKLAHVAPHHCTHCF